MALPLGSDIYRDIYLVNYLNSYCSQGPSNNVYAGPSQVLWSDAVYVRSFIRFHELQPADLLKIARLLHDVYGSFDLAQLALGHVDRQTGSRRQATYLQRLLGLQEGSCDKT